MSLHQDVKEFLRFLNQHPEVRVQIRAEQDKTLLYAGDYNKPVYKEIYDDREAGGVTLDKTILQDAIRKISHVDMPHSNLENWANNLDQIEPWQYNGFIVWKALSGIFASNATGKVSFMIGSGVSKANNKVFAANEAAVLNRNPNIDSITKDILQYYLSCIKSNHSNINLSLMRG